MDFLIKAGNKPPVTSTPGKPKKATTFQEFESITSDAWDVGDDDDELLAMAAQNLNIEVVMETANKVIENHSKQQERRQQQLDEPPGPEEKYDEEGHGKDEEERLEEDETTTELSFSSEHFHHSDSRLVKSHSEAPIGSPKEMSGDRAALYRQQSLPHRPLIPLVARMADQNTSGTPAMTEREASRLDKFRQLLAGPNTDLARYIGTCERCGRAVKEINQPVVLSERSLFSSPVSETEAASEQHTDHILPPTPSPLSLTNTPLFLRHSIGGDIALCCGAVGRKIREKAETLQKVISVPSPHGEKLFVIHSPVRRTDAVLIFCGKTRISDEFDLF
ncbi:TBC1 domain family member 22A isoform X1 [Tachysurus ichikawai]